MVIYHGRIRKEVTLNKSKINISDDIDDAAHPDTLTFHLQHNIHFFVSKKIYNNTNVIHFMDRVRFQKTNPPTRVGVTWKYLMQDPNDVG